MLGVNYRWSLDAGRKLPLIAGRWPLDAGRKLPLIAGGLLPEINVGGEKFFHH